VAQLAEHPSAKRFYEERKNRGEVPRIRSLMQLGSGSCASMRVRTTWVLLSATGQKLPIRKLKLRASSPKRERSLVLSAV
jgi:hypothetical protein